MAKTQQHIDMSVQERHVSVSALLNPWSPNDSSPRGGMAANMFAQAPVFEGTEPKINPTGIEQQLVNNTFKIVTEEDFVVLDIVTKYPEIRKIGEYPIITVVGEYQQSKRMEALVIPIYFSLTQNYGFRYKRNEELLASLTIGMTLPAGTVLADTPNVKEDTYCYGINANIALITDPVGGQDGVIVNEDLLHKLRYKIYQKRVITCSLDEILLNTHGDDELYKFCPDIGEHVKDLNIIGATRKVDYSIAPALTERSTLRDYDPESDKCQFVKPTKELDLPDGTTMYNNKVVDIVVHKSPKTKHRECMVEPPQLEKYLNVNRKYHEGLISSYENKRNANRRMGIKETRCTPNFQNMVRNAYGIINREGEKIVYKQRNEPLDLYYIEIITEVTIQATIGYKLTDSHGSKGMIVEIRPGSKMPIDKWGNVADIIMDPTSISGRMNAGRLYEIYYGVSSRQMKRKITEYVKTLDFNNTKGVNDIFNVVLGYLKIIGNDQYNIFLTATHDEKVEFLKETVEKEFYVKTTISNPKPYMEVTAELEASDYALESTKLKIDGEWTEHNVVMGPVYLFLLNKSSDNYLATSSSVTNHYGLPVRRNVGDKHTIPFSDNPPRILSETELRFIANNCNSPILAAELKDRSSSSATHKLMYRRLLQEDKPTGLDVLVDRKKHPYGGDEALNIIKGVFGSLGVDLGEEL